MTATNSKKDLSMDIIIKTPDQIEGIRKSCQLAAKTLNFATSLVKENWT